MLGASFFGLCGVRSGLGAGAAKLSQTETSAGCANGSSRKQTWTSVAGYRKRLGQRLLGWAAMVTAVKPRNVLVVNWRISRQLNLALLALLKIR